MRNWEKDDITFGKTTAKILKLAGLIHSERQRRFRNDKQNKSYMVTGKEREERHGQFLDGGNATPGIQTSEAQSMSCAITE